MGKTVRKLIKGSWYNIGTIESWLSDMAKQGLLLKKVGGFRAVFEEADPQDIEYRIKLFKMYPRYKDEEVGPTQEQVKLFDEYGWELAVFKKGIFVYRNNGTEYTELPVDEEEVEARLQTVNARYYVLSIPLFYTILRLVTEIITRDKELVVTGLFAGLVAAGAVILILTVVILLMFLKDRKLFLKDKNLSYSRRRKIAFWIIAVTYVALNFFVIFVVSRLF